MASPPNSTTTINDLPDVLLSTILSLVSTTRSRNSASLVCHKWCLLERATRTSLALRGNLREIFKAPTCFPSLPHLDLSLLSPWGHPLPDPDLVARILRSAFPTLTSLTLYARGPSTFHVISSQWHNLKHLKLVRWHQRPQANSPGDELKVLFQQCEDVKSLESLDLSTFYCLTEDVAPALQAYPAIAGNLRELDLLNASFSEGFKSDEIRAITRVCGNLRVFKAACLFDHRYIDFVGDEALLAVSGNCPKLAVLHLVDSSGFSGARGDPEDGGFAADDSRLNVATLVEFFTGLPLLEELVLDVCGNVRDSGPALEVLHSRCLRLRSLRLGQFHGVSVPVESRLDGVALCWRLESLSIRSVGDLTDMGLIAIARGCCRLARLELVGCKGITMRGMRTLACLLRRTLVDVRISCCKNLGAVSSLRALEPVQDRIERLHIDCVWDCAPEEIQVDFGGMKSRLDLNCLGGTSDYDDSTSRVNKKGRYSYDLDSCYTGEELDLSSNGYENGNVFGERTWDRLKYLSLWISVGQPLTPITSSGLENCPNLEEIKIKVEGDCREMSEPSESEFGLSSLLNYLQLSRMQLDCGDIIGYAYTAPSGQMDLSFWERFYLYGIGHLGLTELDYWPPQDMDLNQRSLSQPAAGLLQECFELRKLFIHGTAHEHFLMFLPSIPGLRDVQLREDYYPAPEDDMSTEMRADSCSRFEAALNGRQIPD